jgi:uncharacterized SAM-binding protein YcdF (DUF218 family)
LAQDGKETGDRKTEPNGTQGIAVRKGWRLRAKVSACALGFLFTLVLMALLFPRQVMVVDSGSVQADVIVVLGGAPERAERAEELFRSGAASKILLTGAGDVADNKRLLVSKGVPEAAIYLEPNSKSTRQNVQFSLPLLRSVGARRVILVTSWYHSRRALTSFRHYASDMRFYSRPSYHEFRACPWSRGGISGYVRDEYWKLPGYWVCYGICPL